MQSRTIVRNCLIPMGLMVLLVVGVGCGAAAAPAEPTVTPTPGIEVPPAVTAARDAVLDYLREGANECVPQVGVRWTASRGGESTPVGYDVYRFKADSCTITITYPQGAAEDYYHVALGDGLSGFCWQAVVDGRGQIVRVGSAAASETGPGNPSAEYCAAEGYTYEIITRADGSTQCGVCVFSDGTACNSWAFFHGECSPGDMTLDEAKSG